jgi:hypothetical protein
MLLAAVAVAAVLLVGHQLRLPLEDLLLVLPLQLVLPLVLLLC